MSMWEDFPIVSDQTVKFAEIRRARDKQLEWRYGISFNRYVEMLYTEQDGRCALMGEEAPNIVTMAMSGGKDWWHVDHDHSCCPGGNGQKTCGKCIRGIVCQRCNVWLLREGVSLEMIEKAVEYLTRYRG